MAVVIQVDPPTGGHRPTLSHTAFISSVHHQLPSPGTMDAQSPHLRTDPYHPSHTLSSLLINRQWAFIHIWASPAYRPRRHPPPLQRPSVIAQPNPGTRTSRITLNSVLDPRPPVLSPDWATSTSQVWRPATLGWIRASSTSRPPSTAPPHRDLSRASIRPSEGGSTLRAPPPVVSERGEGQGSSPLLRRQAHSSHSLEVKMGMV